MTTISNLDQLTTTITSRDVDETKRVVSRVCSENQNSAELIKSRLEIFVRHEALRLGGSNVPVDAINRFVEFVISLAREELCAKALSVLIMQDIFESSTRPRCEELFAVVEITIDTWKSPFFFDPCRNNVLRMCNDLLKRLSRTFDTTFCGRILILLAKSFPLNERSGLNLMSQNNLTNLTTFEAESDEKKEEVDEEPPVEKMEVEIGEISEAQDVIIDHELYVKFWTLQEYFANPNLAYKKDKWTTFENNLNDVLLVLSASKLERTRSDRSPTPSAVSNSTDEAKEADESSLFSAKYLTRQKLFQFQLADSQFRRYFLCQCVILFRYFLTSGVKFRDSTCLLTPTQEKSVEKLADWCAQLLRETHPHGRHFATSMKYLIANDVLWSGWKNEGCPDWVSQQSKPEKLLAFKRKPIQSYDPNVLDLGNPELTRLWHRKNSEIAEADRKFVPDETKFLDELLDELDPDQQVDEKYMRVYRDKFQWTCSRFLLHVTSQQSRVIPPMAMGTEKTNNVTAAQYLKSLVLDTAGTIGELKEKSTDIRTKLDATQKKKDEEKAEAEAAEKMKLEKKERQEKLLKAIEVEKQKQQERETKKEKSEVEVKVEQSPTSSTERPPATPKSTEQKPKSTKSVNKTPESSKSLEKKDKAGDKRSQSTEKPPTTPKDEKPPVAAVKTEEKPPTIKSDRSSTKRPRSPASSSRDRSEASGRSQKRPPIEAAEPPPKRPPIREPEAEKKEEMPAPKKPRSHHRSKDEKSEPKERKRDRRDEPGKRSK